MKAKLIALLFFGFGAAQVYSLQAVAASDKRVFFLKYGLLAVGLSALLIFGRRTYKNEVGCFVFSLLAIFLAFAGLQTPSNLWLAVYITLALALAFFDESYFLPWYTAGVFSTFVLMMLTNAREGVVLHEGERIRYSYGFASPNFVAILSSYCIAYLFFYSKRPFWLRLATVIVLAFLIVLSDSRTGLVSASVGTLLLIPIVRAKRLQLGKVFNFVFGVVVVAYLGFITSVSTQSAFFRTIDEATSGRLTLSRRSLEAFSVGGGASYIESFFVSSIGAFGIFGVCVLLTIWVSGFFVLDNRQRQPFPKAIYVYTLLFGLGENVGFSFNVPLSVAFSAYAVRYFGTRQRQLSETQATLEETAA